MTPTIDIPNLQRAFAGPGQDILQSFYTHRLSPDTAQQLLGYIIGLTRGALQLPIDGNNYLEAIAIGWAVGASHDYTMPSPTHKDHQP